ncbi:serine/threonine-protein kinase [Actinocorallia sp. API 0066]|uniref:serine/threonine-protein kinase n=1 Tax=Actinocorallia sp. API 0066 TaxID=2896846 RepID=UPI001E4AAE57|nr:serine/threonine-protein kinase [Actinocorallia sp. API 0066]MCD0448081.1 serine/threonine-protein kinase [Actinocorallia sp. API 0066]
MTDGVVLGGRYRLGEQIGKGGMGQVFKAVDTRLEREVAVKVLPQAPDQDSVGVARFLREARLAATLQHPGITVVHDIDVDEGVLYLVMELLNGRDLHKLLESRPGGLPLDQGVDLAVQITEALGAAHARGVVHRDLKPANVMIVEGGRAKLCDFGIAKHLSSATGLTGSGVLGTPVYMAPEQFLGREIDARTDVYLLGGMFHELFCGKPPFPIDEGLEELVQGHLRHQPKGPRHHNPSVPPEIDRLVLDMLAKEPADRPADAAEIVRRLKALGPVQAASPAPAPAPAVPAAGHRAPSAPSLPPVSPHTPPPTPAAEYDQLHSRAARYCHEGRYADAITAAEQASNGRARLLGPEHPDTLSSRNILASALYLAGRGMEAEAVARTVAQSRARIFGGEHPRTLRSWLLVAKILYTVGRSAEALPIAQGVARDRSRTFGPENAETQEARNTEGWALHALGRHPEALGVAFDTATARGRLLGNEHPDTLETRLLLGLANQAVGQFPRAHAIATALKTDCHKVLGPAHPLTARAEALWTSLNTPSPTPYYR